MLEVGSLRVDLIGRNRCQLGWQGWDRHPHKARIIGGLRSVMPDRRSCPPTGTGNGVAMPASNDFCADGRGGRARPAIGES